MYATTDLFGRIQTSKKSLAAARRELRGQPRPHMEALCERKFPHDWDALAARKANSRRRLYTPRLTGLTFLAQVLSPGSSCREAVRWVQGDYALLPGGPKVRSSTSPYCQARARLDPERLVRLRRHLAERMEANVSRGTFPWSRPIKVVDGTCFNLPDTPANRAAYPPAPGQRPGCGFPLMRMVGVFSLQAGACTEHSKGAYLTGEGSLFRQLWPTFQADDIALGDRLFESYGNLAGLQQRGVDSIFRINAQRPLDFRRGRPLGRGDRLHAFPKPARPAKGWTPEEWEALPASLPVRLIRAQVHNPEGRLCTVILTTTLLDPVLWPKELLLLIFKHRWKVELYLDDIKTTLQMDMLSCRTPPMVAKELEMHLIAYNLTRSVMQEAATVGAVPLARISFKGTLDTLRSYAHTIACIPVRQRQKRRAVYAQMLLAIATDPVPDRPGRREPRCLKRRPKAYPFMTKPRAQMQDPPKSFRRRAKSSSA